MQAHNSVCQALHIANDNKTTTLIQYFFIDVLTEQHKFQLQSQHNI
jgi:hypothetical protein